LPNTDLISTLGPLTRTVDDAAPFLAATAGPDDRDPWSIAGPTPDFLRGLEGGIEGSRIAAGRHRDLAVLRASRAFEPARPWAGWRPAL
jgi:Asp-tRNA(Asn)/Glu-tRNA(Gln) amidotransferase A subunit family amidase